MEHVAQKNAAVMRWIVFGFTQAEKSGRKKQIYARDGCAPQGRT